MEKVRKLPRAPQQHLPSDVGLASVAPNWHRSGAPKPKTHLNHLAFQLRCTEMRLLLAVPMQNHEKCGISMALKACSDLLHI